MNYRITFFSLMLLMVAAVSAQGKLDVYKYMIIPKQFDFQKSQDSYQINSLTKFLFEREGFVVIYSDEAFPTELRNNPCLALNANIIDNSTMFKTKLSIEMKDCYNQVVLQSTEADSKEKDLKKGYHEAIRKAFEMIEQANYKYAQQLVLKDEKVAKEQKPIQKEIGITEEIIVEKPIPVEPKYQEKVAVIAEIAPSKIIRSIEGNFQSTSQLLTIQKQGNQFIVSDKQQNVIGIMYPTSQATYFILKWLQNDDNHPKLVFLNSEGDLLIDEKETSVVYKRKSL